MTRTSYNISEYNEIPQRLDVWCSGEIPNPDQRSLTTRLLNEYRFDFTDPWKEENRTAIFFNPQCAFGKDADFMTRSDVTEAQQDFCDIAEKNEVTSVDTTFTGNLYLPADEYNYEGSRGVTVGTFQMFVKPKVEFYATKDIDYAIDNSHDYIPGRSETRISRFQNDNLSLVAEVSGYAQGTVNTVHKDTYKIERMVF